MNKKAALITISNNFINKGVAKIIQGIQYHSECIQVFDLNQLTQDQAKEIVFSYKIVIFDDYILNIDYLKPRKNMYLINNWLGIEHYRELVNVLMRADKKILWLCHHDLHGEYIIDEMQRKKVKKEFNYLIWFYEHHNLSKTNILEKYKDQWMEYYKDPMENKSELISIFKFRIDLPFSVETSHLQKIKDRDVIIPGISYATRRIAQESLSRYKKQFALSRYKEKENVFLLILLLCRKLPFILSKGIYLRINKQREKNYKDELARSKICWIDGSAYSYPVNKFFEAIESKTLIVTNGLEGLEQYGYKPNIHYIMSLPEDFGQTVKHILLHQNELIHEITDNALNHSLQYHHTLKRVNQLDECIRQINFGNFFGASFVNGHFKIKNNASDN